MRFSRTDMARSFQIVVQVEGGEPQAYTFGGGGLLLGDSDTAGLRVPGWRAEHLQVVVAVDRLEVDPCDHAEGVLVNGYPIDGAVCVEYPAILTFGRTAVWVLVPDDAGGSPEAAQPLDTGTLVPETWHAPADRRPSTDTAATIAPVRKSVFEARTRIIASMATPTLHSQATIPVRGTGGAVGGGRDAKEEHAPDSAAIDGRYRLAGQIARGGMGRIYEGVELRLKRRVAVKVSTLGDAGNPRFVREAEILANLAHPNIVPIHGFGVDTFGRACYTMKLIKGRTLQAILDGLRNRDGDVMRQFTRDRLLGIFRKICDAMAFSHAANIIHRDLKPENVMVGEFGEVQVMDWGLAKEVGGVEHLATSVQFDAGPEDFGRTLEGEVMGTPQYMSPEQAEGRVMELDVRSDIYSLGAVLYAILTLRAPVDGGTVEEVLTKVKRGEITSMVSPSTRFRDMRLRAVVAARRMHGNVPDALQAVVRRAMHLRPAARYQSVSELSADIEAYQGGFATRAERAGFFRQVFLLLRRNRTVAIAHVVVIAVCGYFLSRIIVGERRALEGAQVAERQALSLKEERDAARLSLAQANVARAEGAYLDSEGEEVVRALEQVPEDLRNSDWSYLRRKLDSAERAIRTPSGTRWTGFEPHPRRTDLFYGMDEGGELYTVDARAGDVVRVGKVVRGGKFQGDAVSLAVSGSGDRVAVLRMGEGEGGDRRVSVDVFEAAAEGRSARIELEGTGPGWFVRGTFGASDRVLVVEANHGGLTRGGWVEAWSLEQGKRLWRVDDRGPVVCELTGDGGRLRMVFEREDAEERDVETGEKTGALGRLIFPEVPGRFFCFGADGKAFFAWNRATGVVRRADVASGDIAGESRVPRCLSMGCQGGNNGLVTLSRQSDNYLSLRWFSGTAGALTRMVPVPVPGGPAVRPRVVVHPLSGAVCVVCSDVVQVWHHAEPVPERVVSGHAGGSAMRPAEFVDATGRMARLSEDLRDRRLEVLETHGAAQSSPSDAVPMAGASAMAASLSGRVVVTSGEELTVFDQRGGRLTRRNGFRLPGVPLQMAVNGEGGLLWTGRRFVDLEKGVAGEPVRRDGFEGIFGGRPSSVWVTEKDVAEVVMVRDGSVGGSTGGVRRAIAVWRVGEAEAVRILSAPEAACLAMCSGEGVIVEGGTDKRVRIRARESLEVLHTFRAHDEDVLDVAAHPTRPLIATCAEDFSVKVWDLKERRLFGEIQGFRAVPARIAFHPDGKGVAVVLGGNRIQILRPEFLAD